MNNFVMSNLSFSHRVLKWLVLQTRKHQCLFGKGLKLFRSGAFTTLFCKLCHATVILKLKLYFNLFAVSVSRTKRFENIVRNDENVGNQHFVHFPQCFYTLLCSYFNLTRTSIYGNITYGPSYFN